MSCTSRHSPLRISLCVLMTLSRLLALLSSSTQDPYTLSARAFFGHCEKNSSSEKLKTQAKSRKNSSRIRKKLKNRQLKLEFFLQTLKFSPFLPMWSIFWKCKFESTVQILHSQYFFTHNTDILIKFCRNWKVIKEAHGAKFYTFYSLDLLKKL